ncbi:RNA-binding region-containing protein 3-like [Vespa mandarinia]|uniref:RNA-binding region-containing protein 3-like n=1 Tax=Vespa mandarinia TaxID=7446 RepID=UPI00160AB702|nr:RNA-binding region-containing protein 3-like [Vespa mandarinia]XP_035729321.1 RNA-binding region-containing protein 3-like [Vespa mandarinia]
MSSETNHIFDTLKVLHLPSYLSDQRRNELFQKYGAIKTRTLRPSSKYTITFVKFPSHSAANEALLRLHQIKVRGQYLSVEFAKKSMPIQFSENEIHYGDIMKDEIHKETVNKSHFQAFLKRLYGGSMNQIFTQPPPPNIKYKYAPPTKNTLLRIIIQLLKEPAFYTQVLHLMNRMNLPPPFEELEAEFPILKEIYDIELYKDILGEDIFESVKGKGFSQNNKKEKETDEEESEIESDEDTNVKSLQNVPIKRKCLQSKKRLKIPKFINPAKQPTALTSIQKTIRPEDMFESVQLGESKSLKIELKTVDKLLEGVDVLSEHKRDNILETQSGFGLMFPTKNIEHAKQNIKHFCEESLEKSSEQPLEKPSDFITKEELASNRISINDQRLLPVFKNYHAGKPTNRLYIKNLAKQVEANDLHYIYKKYVIPGLPNTEHEYNVRLMQEGRMKGQAFVTLQNTAQAQLAVQETNGYILKEKPMVVQYAKVSNS